MSETDERPQPARDESALASSTPDNNTILMRMLQMLIGSSEGKHGILTAVSTLLAGLIMIVYVVTTWGVPALLAGQTLILQWKQSDTEQVVADRAVQQQQVTATRDVLTAIGEVGTKLDMQSRKIDAQGKKLDEQGVRIDALFADVTVLKRDQAGTARSVSEVRARQLQADAVRREERLPPASR